MANDGKKNICCSFCGKPRDQVNRLIAGNNSYICDDCVRLCMGIIDENYDPDEGYPGLGRRSGRNSDASLLPG